MDTMILSLRIRVSTINLPYIKNEQITPFKTIKFVKSVS